MKIYKYVARKLERDNIDLDYIFGAKKRRRMINGIDEMVSNGFSISIEKLDENLLDDFYNNVYKIQIEKKNNPKVHDLFGWYSKKDKENLFLACIRKDSKLIGGCSFEYAENISKLKISYKASENILVKGFGLGLYLDYIVFEDAIKHGIKKFSRGRDRNGYGLIGSNTGLVIQKLMTKFLPYLGIDREEIEINENEILVETLVFFNPDDEGKFREANFWTDKNDYEIEQKFGLIRNAGIKLNIYKLK